MIVRQNDLINGNMKIMNNYIFKQNILNKNKDMNEIDLFINIKMNNGCKSNVEDKYFTNEKSYTKHYKNDENVLI